MQAEHRVRGSSERAESRFCLHSCRRWPRTAEADDAPTRGIRPW